VRSSASLNSASAPRRELFLPSHLALRHHRGSMLNFLALPQGDGATIELGADWSGQGAPSFVVARAQLDFDPA
jgi:hypothetical protein